MHAAAKTLRFLYQVQEPFELCLSVCDGRASLTIQNKEIHPKKGASRAETS